MILTEATRHHPGSKEAAKHGCTCMIDKDDHDKYYITSDCPIHWHINLVGRTGMMHDYIVKKDKTHTHLLYALIALAVFTIGLFAIKGF